MTRKLTFDGTIEKETTTAKIDSGGDVELVTNVTLKDLHVAHADFPDLLALMAEGKVRITVEAKQSELDFGKGKQRKVPTDGRAGDEARP